VCGYQMTRCCRLSTGQRRSVRRNPPAGDVGRELDPSTWSAESTTVTAANMSNDQQQHRLHVISDGNNFSDFHKNQFTKFRPV